MSFWTEISDEATAIDKIEFNILFFLQVYLQNQLRKFHQSSYLSIFILNNDLLILLFLMFEFPIILECGILRIF